MKELKSKKTGKIQIVSDADYALLVKKGLNTRFIVTELNPRAAMPTVKPAIKKPKDEG